MLTRNVLPIVAKHRALNCVLYLSCRFKSVIKPTSYRVVSNLKKNDIRYKTSNKHRPKLMSWQDYQDRKWKADHWQRRFACYQAKMDYAESLCRLGMSTFAIEQITHLTPFVIEYLKRKLSGNIEVVGPATYSNYVNHRPGSY